MAGDDDRTKSSVEKLKEAAVVDQILRIPTLVGLVDERVKSIQEQMLKCIKTYEEKVLAGESRAWYIAIVALAVGFTAFLVIKGWVGSPTVPIVFNDGEIISGILIGGAALLASAAYRRRSECE